VGVRYETSAHRKDGSALLLDLVISAIKLEIGPRFTIIARNITERRTLEREVLEARTREQQRISRDLHDRVGQELTGLGYLAASLTQELDAAP
jgi:signal transduction histidine kinase